MTINIEELQKHLDSAPFHKMLPMKIISADSDNGTITVKMGYSPNFQRIADSGEIHGGAIASLVDIAGDFALIYLLGKGVPTINFRVDYLRPAVNTDLVAIARVRRAGKTIGVVDIDVTNEAGKLVAVGTGCYGTGY